MSNKITENFTWDEYYHSDTANAKGIVNTPPKQSKAKIEKSTTNLFKTTVQPIRNLIGRAITVTSGYSNSALNKALGRKDTTQHSLGEAVDLSVVGFSNLAAARMIVASNTPFDQLIFERRKNSVGKHYDWIHVSCKLNIADNRREVLYSPPTGGYVKGLPDA